MQQIFAVDSWSWFFPTFQLPRWCACLEKKLTTITTTVTTRMTILERTQPPCWACSVMLGAASPSAEAHAQSQKIWSCPTECPSCVRHTLASPDLEWEAHGGCALPTCPRKLTVASQIFALVGAQVEQASKIRGSSKYTVDSSSLGLQGNGS